MRTGGMVQALVPNKYKVLSSNPLLPKPNNNDVYYLKGGKRYREVGHGGTWLQS
jgi:hypothetical protein